LYSPSETLLVLQNAGSTLGIQWSRTEISSQLNLEQTDEGNWRRRAIDPQNRRSCQETCTEIDGTWGGRGIRGIA
jgi:hypothetical protein